MTNNAFKLKNSLEFDVVFDSLKSCGVIEIEEEDIVKLKEFWEFCNEAKVPFFFNLKEGTYSLVLLDEIPFFDFEVISNDPNVNKVSLPAITWQEFVNREYGNGKFEPLKSKEEILTNLKKIEEA